MICSCRRFFALGEFSRALSSAVIILSFCPSCNPQTLLNASLPSLHTLKFCSEGHRIGSSSMPLISSFIEPFSTRSRDGFCPPQIVQQGVDTGRAFSVFMFCVAIDPVYWTLHRISGVPALEGYVDDCKVAGEVTADTRCMREVRARYVAFRGAGFMLHCPGFRTWLI